MTEKTKTKIENMHKKAPAKFRLPMQGENRRAKLVRLSFRFRLQ